MIDFTINEAALAKAVERARERNIIIPTFAQMAHPEGLPDRIKAALADVGLWDVNPLNLFRITWKNQAVPAGGGYGGVNYLELPKALTGCDARIIALVGKWFPTGAHKVGAAFGCLVPRLVTGQFDPTTQKAVWPSTGNYCRGGAYDSALLGCESIAILPEEMSQERFEWLDKVAGEVIKTPGSESNVKEIFDKCWELRNSGQDLVIFNQFDELGNYLWHHEITGRAIVEVLKQELGPDDRYHGVVSATGSGGTIACGDYLKKLYPASKVVASEALQCPTLLNNGFGAHRIEGIGDKHVPWIHNVRNTDMIVAIDDEAPMSLIRLFNEPAGHTFLKDEVGIDANLVDALDLLGISGVGNLLAAIKTAKWHELTEHDVVVTVFTDSMELYQSRLAELTAEHGELSERDAAVTYERWLQGTATDHMEELTHPTRRRVHNLKYYTWVEQQGRTYEEIQRQWYDPEYWQAVPAAVGQLDELIDEFNGRTGLLKS
ncbi:MAG: pyridoxal-phosphate dependent enzyme [Deltaproteobacteria bacterium]|nr:pyridoxal-phosphate dependent enzyme [Deltaproteobacteria bacterium]